MFSLISNSEQLHIGVFLFIKTYGICKFDQISSRIFSIFDNRISGFAKSEVWPDTIYMLKKRPESGAYLVRIQILVKKERKNQFLIQQKDPDPTGFRSSQ